MVVEENKHRGSVVAGMNRCSASKDYKRMQLNFFLPETTVTSSPVSSSSGNMVRRRVI